jgi:predicted ATPase/tetratricopeptide (TPR) repeat protein
MGEVWEAVLHGPRGFRRTVALKLLRPSHEVDHESREALLHEARVGALLAHPNVVAIHEAGEVDGRVFVAMELVHGVPVSRLIRYAPLPPAAVRSVGEQAARGLHHCHAFEIDGEPVGLVHRDVKPRNLLVDRYGTVRIADLGIARLVGTGAHVAGTVGYMPPEQSMGLEDSRADIFALGVTLYLLATLTLPFGAVLFEAEGLRRQLANPALLGAADKAVPGLGPILQRCLQPDPDDRFSNALDLAEAIALLGRSGEDLGAVVGRVLGVDRETPAAPPRREGHLPTSDDQFVGRDAERTAIVARIDGADRVFTLLGPGGSGKTRLALEIAREVAPRFPGGAWFVDLSGACSQKELCTAVARTFQVPLAEVDPVSQIGRAIRGRGKVLVLLDNFEQLVREASDAVTAWAMAAPEATLVLTSRTALRLSEERALSLGPMDDADAVALFRERAAAITASDDTIRDLVRQLDGLPLAIELAAARTRTLGVEEISARLHERFRLLAGGGFRRPERHRSLRASLESSWELLAPWEEQALAQLSVFVDGFVLDAATAVVDLRAWPEAPSLLAVLGSAYDQSLLRVDRSGRFRMLHTIREYAAQVRTPAQRASDEARHMAYFAQFGSPDALAALDRHGGEEGRRRLAADIENLVVAVRRAVARGDAASAAGAALAAWPVLYERGPIELGLEVLRLAQTVPSPVRVRELRAEEGAALVVLHRNDEARAVLEPLIAEADTGPDAVQVRSLLRLSYVEQIVGHNDEARALLDRALGLALVSGFTRSVGEARTGLGSLLQRESRPAESITYLEAALELQRSIGDRRAEANTQILLGMGMRELDRIDDARSHLEEALAIARRIGSVSVEARALGNLGILLHQGGEWDEAEGLYLAALALHRQVGLPRSEAITLGNLGTLHRLRGRLDDAILALEASAAGHLEGGDRMFQGHAVANLGNCLRDAGRPREALRRYDTAIYLYHSVGQILQEVRVVRNSARTARVLGQNGDEIARLERAIALAAEADLAVETARSRAELLLARIAAGDRDGARADLPATAELAECDAYSVAAVRFAQAALRPVDDPEAATELEEAIGLLEPLDEPVQLASCLLELAARSGDRAGAILDRAEQVLGTWQVPEAVVLLRARAASEADPVRARVLREAAEAKAVAIGVPAGVGLRA